MKLKGFFIAVLLMSGVDALAFQNPADSILAITRQNDALLLRADSLKNNNLFEEALEYWEYVLQDIKALPQTRIRALSESADLHRILHHDSLAYQRLTEARSLLRLYHGKFPELENQHLNFLGTYFFHQNQPDSAIVYYRRAEITAEKRKDKLLQFQAYKGLGEVYDHLLNNQYAARYYYKKSLMVIGGGEIDLPNGEADALFELANIERKLGEKDVAVTLGLRTVKKAEELDQKIYYDFIANANFLLGHLNMERQRFRDAIPYLRKAIAVRSEKLGKVNQFNFNLYYPTLASAYEASGQPDSAIILQKILLDNYVSSNPAVDPTGTTYYLKIGELYLKNNEPRKARPYVLKALQFHNANRASGSDNLFQALLLKGDLYAAEDRYDSAMHAYEQALKLIDSHITVNNILGEVTEARVSVQKIPMAAKAIEKIALSLAILSQTKGDTSQLNYSLELFNEALEFARFSAIAEPPGSSSFHVRNFHLITEEALTLAHQLYELSGDRKYLAKAFEWMENDKLIAIQEESEEALYIHKVGLPDSIRAEKEALNSRLNLIIGEMETATADSVRERLESELIVNFEKLSIWREKADDYLQHYHNHYNLFNVAAWDDFRDKNGIHVIEYFQGDHFIFGLSNGDSVNYFLKQRLDDDFRAAVGNFLTHFAATPSKFSHEEFQHYVASAKNIYDWLVAPLMPPLPTDKQVIVIPDGLVTLIPFEALLTSSAEGLAGYHQLPYLIHSCTMSYITSAAMLLDLPVVIPKHNSQLISFAFDKRLADKAPTVAYIRDEIENAKLYYEGMTFRGRAATKEAFLRMAPRFEILYLLIHGEGVPFPRLEFARGLNDDVESDLYAHELYNLKLPGQIVVVTSTETGMELVKHGESVVSLVRAFLSAGAGAVIIGLWEAHDEHSLEIVGKFFRKLAVGENTMVALRSAKTDFILKSDSLTAHPHNWAELVSYGEPVDVSTKKDRRYMVWLMIIGGIFVLGTYVSAIREKYIDKIITEDERKRQLRELESRQNPPAES